MLGRWSAAPPSTAPGQGIEPVRAEAPDLGPLLTEIRQGHDAILRELREKPTAPNAEPTRQPAITDEKLDRLTAAVAQMNERLEAGLLKAGKGSGLASLVVLQDTLRRKKALIDAGVEPRGSLDEELRTAHAGWTRDDFVSRYGPPRGTAELDDGTRILTYFFGDTHEEAVDFQLFGGQTRDAHLRRPFIESR